MRLSAAYYALDIIIYRVRARTPLQQIYIYFIAMKYFDETQQSSN